METPLKQIPVVTELSVKDFNEQYFENNIPVIIKGYMKKTQAYKTWTPDHLSTVIGSRMINLAYSQKGVYNFQKGQAVHLNMPFNEAVTYMQLNNSYYISQSSLQDNFPELVNDVTDPEWIGPSDPRRSTNLWFGGAGCVSPLHFDTSHNFLAQIYGRKDITLYAPADSKYLYPSSSNVSAIDMEDTAKFPLFKYAKPYPVVLEPGDILYLPFYWWHLVRSLDVSISVNFWWERFEFVYGAGIEMAPVEELKKMIRRFLDMGIPVDQKNSEGETNLLKACDRGAVNIVRALLESGADPTVKSNKYKGSAAVTIAAERGHTQIVDILYQHTRLLEL